MDLDLSNLSWEQKALIGIGAIVLIILIYAYVPWGGFTTEVDNTTVPINVQTNTKPAYVPVNNPVANDSSDSSDSSNSDISDSSNTDSTNVATENNTNTSTNPITSLQAKEIAAQEGLTPGSPSSSTFKVDNENVQVWKVPLSENNVVVKEVYIDKNTGNIVSTNEKKTISKNNSMSSENKTGIF